MAGAELKIGELLTACFVGVVVKGQLVVVAWEDGGGDGILVGGLYLELVGAVSSLYN